MGNDPEVTSSLLGEIRSLIDTSRQRVAVSVNHEMTLLYWQIGIRINQEILKDKRADYGKRVVVNLSKYLITEYGSSFSEKNLRRMMQFAEIFPDKEIVVSMIRQLSWTHIIAIIPIKDPLKRNFYIEMCKIEKWSVRTFRERINSIIDTRMIEIPIDLKVSLGM